MDAYFASVEQLDNPELKKKPVIVGGNPWSRGVVAACSYEARRFGIHSAMPSTTAFKLCPHAIFLRPNMDRYRKISHEIMEIFTEYADLVEPLSLDEAFIDVTENKKGVISATRIANLIRRQIYKETGLTASAGVSFNKFLAKVASDQNKPNGTYVIPPEQAQSFLSALPIGKFYGIGKVTEKKMFRLGIYTGGDLLHWQRSLLINHFGKTGSYLYDIARGQDYRKVSNNRKRKSIGAETTLPHDTSNRHKIQAILERLAEKIEKSLALKECGGLTLTLKIRYTDFTTVTRSKTLKTPIFAKEEMMALVPILLKTTEVGLLKVRLLGMTISKLSNEYHSTPYQLKLPFPLHGAQ